MTERVTLGCCRRFSVAFSYFAAFYFVPFAFVYHRDNPVIRSYFSNEEMWKLQLELPLD